MFEHYARAAIRATVLFVANIGTNIFVQEFISTIMGQPIASPYDHTDPFGTFVEPPEDFSE